MSSLLISRPTSTSGVYPSGVDGPPRKIRSPSDPMMMSNFPSALRVFRDTRPSSATSPTSIPSMMMSSNLHPSTATVYILPWKPFTLAIWMNRIPRSLPENSSARYPPSEEHFSLTKRTIFQVSDTISFGKRFSSTATTLFISTRPPC